MSQNTIQSALRQKLKPSRTGGGGETPPVAWPLPVRAEGGASSHPNTSPAASSLSSSAVVTACLRPIPRDIWRIGLLARAGGHETKQVARVRGEAVRLARGLSETERWSHTNTNMHTMQKMQDFGSREHGIGLELLTFRTALETGIEAGGAVPGMPSRQICTDPACCV